MIHTSFSNNKGYSLHKICMSPYFMVMVSIFIYCSKKMSFELKRSVSSLSSSDDKLKPYQQPAVLRCLEEQLTCF